MPKKIIKLLTVVFVAIIISFFIFLGFLSTKYVAPIIMYHSFGPEADIKTMLVVKPETFQRQMRFLKENGYHVMPLEELAVLIRDKKKLPPKAVSITIDDGYKDNFTYAFSVLKQYNLPATIFIIVNEVGRPDRLSWDQIKIMQDSGLVTIGSHALGPEPLVKIDSPEQLRKEIFSSKHILEEKLGKKVNLFSYPEGMFDAKIRQLVIDAGYLAAVGTNPGINYPNNDRFVLKRLRISERAANMFVFAVEVSGFYTYLKESKRSRR